MSILLLTSLFIIGYFNSHQEVAINNQKGLVQADHEKLVSSHEAFSHFSENTHHSIATNSGSNDPIDMNGSSEQVQTTISGTAGNSTFATHHQTGNNQSREKRSLASHRLLLTRASQQGIVGNAVVGEMKAADGVTDAETAVSSIDADKAAMFPSVVKKMEAHMGEINLPMFSLLNNNETTAKERVDQPTNSIAENLKQQHGKMSWQLYATPSIVYRRLFNNLNVFSSGNIRTFTITSPETMDHEPALGLEVGGSLRYQLFKHLKVSSGLQLNYTKYNLAAYENSHPISTTLTLIDFNYNTPYQISSTTNFSSQIGEKAIKLHNETFQLSIPMGAELIIAGKEQFQWSVAANIQPTVVLASKSYLLSSDASAYIKENSFLNRFNMNAGIGTFISYVKNGYTWQMGPTFRKQLFSTNSRTYTVEERLNNYGFMIGMSKRF